MGIPSIDALGPRGKGFHPGDEYIEAKTLISRAQALADYLLG
jgi:glutamate carboxypeptidase